MSQCYKIEQAGFVSEYEYDHLENGDQKIFFSVTGHFVRLKDDLTALYLFDDYARIFHPIEKVSFLQRISNAIEGENLYPRPFITEQTDEEKKIKGYKLGSIILSTGDKVEIAYVNGSIFNPLVRGSIKPFGSFYQNNFLLTKPEEWEQEKKRLENEDYSIEYKDDSHGEITLDIIAKAKDSTKKNQGGTGNVTINLVGTDSNGNINLNLNGKAILIQKDKDGKTSQRLLLDNTKDKNIARISQGIESNGVFKEVQFIELDQEKKKVSLIQKDSAGNAIKQSIIMDENAKKTTILNSGQKIEVSETSVLVNEGTKGAARMDDEVTVTVDPSQIKVDPGSHMNPSTITLKGKITQASGTIKLGD
jgi:hypothetical protein